jgi:hypothetical protein
MRTLVRSAIGLTRLIGLDRNDSLELRQDGCLARRNEGRARKDGSQDRGQNEKIEILQGILVPWMDIHQARTEAMKE